MEKISYQTVLDLEKQLEKIRNQKTKTCSEKIEQCCQIVKIIAKIQWIYKNFSMFNMGWVNGYPGEFQCPDEKSSFTLTKQQQLDFDFAGHNEYWEMKGYR